MYKYTKIMYIMHIYTAAIFGSFPGASLPTVGQKRELIGEAPNGSFRKGRREGGDLSKGASSKEEKPVEETEQRTFCQ